MAKTIKYSSFKRGDTPVFSYTFTAPVEGYDWTTAFADWAMTDVEAPADNSGAAAIRTGETITDNGDGTGTFSVQLTTIESNALTPEATYSVEVQIKDNGGSNVATVSTGTVTILQDYVI